MHASSLRGGALDLLSVPRWAFSDRKMLLHAPGALAAVALVWAVGRYWGPFTPWTIALTAVGAALAAMPGSAAVSRLTLLQLDGDFFAPAKRAPWSAHKAVLAPLAVLTLIPAAVLGLAFLGGAMGGPLGGWWVGLGMLLLIPGLFVGLLLLFALFVWTLGLLALPSIAGVSGESGMETSYQLVVMCWTQGWRVLGYEALTLLLSALSASVFAAASLAGLFLLTQTASLAHADLSVVSGASVALFVSLFMPMEAPLPLETPLLIGAWIGAGVLVLLLWTSVSYLFSGLSVGNTLLYIHLRQRIWGDNVFKEKLSGTGGEGEDTVSC